MTDEMIWIDRFGYPVEHIEGRPVLNWLRDRIHGKRKMTRSKWDQIDAIARNAVESVGEEMKCPEE